MPERNLCRELGCQGACCRNIHGQLASSTEYFLKMFPEAAPVSSMAEALEKIKKQEHGVYYYPERGWIYFSVSGDCPNLKDDLSCRVHGQRFYPSFCTNMTFGSIGCSDSQQIFKLNSISAKIPET
jgi:hypothetical protein